MKMKTKIVEFCFGIAGLVWFMGLWVWKKVEQLIWKKA